MRLGFSLGISCALGLPSPTFLLFSYILLAPISVYPWYKHPALETPWETHPLPTVLILCQYCTKWARLARLTNGPRNSSKEI